MFAARTTQHNRFLPILHKDHQLPNDSTLQKEDMENLPKSPVKCTTVSTRTENLNSLLSLGLPGNQSYEKM